MDIFLSIACLILAVLLLLVWIQNHQMRKAVDEIRHSFRLRLGMDTNIGIDTASTNPAIRALAADLDLQVKILRKQQLQYQSGNRNLQEAMANLSHDIRTPLTAIMAYLDLLEQEALPQPSRQYLDVINNRIHVLKTLVEDLFQYTLANADASKPKELICINQVLETCMAQQYAAFTAKQILPEIDIPLIPVKRYLHPAYLTRILDNIIGNALKYSDGDFSVALSEDGCIRFANHASLLDEITIGKLMNRYYTLEDGKGSTGLGLHIAKTLTEQMGGTLQLYLQDNVFTIKLYFPKKNPDD